MSEFASGFKKITRNENGQMAVFIALIFQVLFVFFAMVINVGLIIHDKINLQNATDLASYYVAQKQAEMLNEIAAMNYQMRQDYKLMAWRLRVMGDYGRPSHPSYAGLGSPPDELYVNAETPSICLAHPGWLERRNVSSSENFCQRAYNSTIPPIPRVTVIAGFLGINSAIAGFVDRMRATYGNFCEGIGPMNWAFTMQQFYAYRAAVAMRKNKIKKLRSNLSADPTDFKDQNLESVAAGARKTLEKNLTQANLQSISEFNVLNSLALQPCNTNAGEGWLPEISIYPYMLYTDGLGGSQNGCTPAFKDHTALPANAGYLAQLDPSGVFQQIAKEPALLSDNWHSSRGFEKNPWCLAYSGVRVKTRPRKPFAPFGQSVTLQARAFAQPFGGRIGPWDKDKWPVSANQSTGDAIDPLAVPRFDPNTGDQLTPQIIPNYSRYPGDRLGLKSQMALAAQRKFFPNTFTQQPLTMAFYDSVLLIDKGLGDPLAWDSIQNIPAFIRNAEVGAVAPDLFDITYYSIETDFFRNYYDIDKRALQLTGKVRFDQVQPIGDLGSRGDNDVFKRFTIENQIALVREGESIDLNLPLFYYVKNPAHVLTAWTQDAIQNFSDFPSKGFANCVHKPKNEPTQGNCVGAGRVGYSVRVVARDYLFFDQHQLGGNDSSTGKIRNPPPAAF